MEASEKDKVKSVDVGYFGFRTEELLRLSGCTLMEGSMFGDDRYVIHSMVIDSIMSEELLQHIFR